MMSVLVQLYIKTNFLFFFGIKCNYYHGFSFCYECSLRVYFEVRVLLWNYWAKRWCCFLLYFMPAELNCVYGWKIFLLGKVWDACNLKKKKKIEACIYKHNEKYEHCFTWNIPKEYNCETLTNFLNPAKLTRAFNICSEPFPCYGYNQSLMAPPDNTTIYVLSNLWNLKRIESNDTSFSNNSQSFILKYI